MVKIVENKLEIFKNEQFGEVRTTVENGNIWFCGSDVAKALGYAKPANAIATHCRYTLKRGIPHPQSPEKEISVVFVSEGDVYRLIAHSKLPSAERFERWVFDEVLPAIRQTGGYIYGEEHLNDDELFARAVMLAQAKLKQREERIAQLQQQNLELQPKANYYDQVLQSDSLVSVTQIAKDFGLSAKALNKILHEKGVQFKQGDTWLLYQKYAEQGLTQSKTHMLDEERCIMHTYWTQKGRLFLYDLLKNEGILPIIEREQIEEGA